MNMPLTSIDHAALLQCLQICERDPEFREQFKDAPDWRERAEHACYRVQTDALHLKPWQTPPCLVELYEDNPNESDAREMLKRMLDAGVSRYDPDPLAALKKKHRRK